MGKSLGERPHGRTASRWEENSNTRTILRKMRARVKWFYIFTSAISEFHTTFVASQQDKPVILLKMT
jgi:hypothetical protein